MEEKGRCKVKETSGYLWWWTLGLRESYPTPTLIHENIRIVSGRKQFQLAGVTKPGC
jgi:hypothetical protein